MSFVIDLCLPALLLSLASLAALRIMPETSIRFRASLAVIGLLAWFLPWNLLTLPVVSSPVLPLQQWVDATASGVGAALPPEAAREAAPAAQPGPWWPLLFVPGALLFLFDLGRRHRRLESLERQSRDGEWLRPQLPDSLRYMPRRIRIIPGSNAMATGVFRGTVWVGEDLCAHSELEAALVHECCHLRRKDTVSILIANLARRLYFWNPVVLWLSRHLQRLIEQACDVESAAVLGRTKYQRSLARLMVDTHANGISLVPMVVAASDDVRRIRALERASASGLRRLNATVLMLAAGLLALSLNAQQRDPRIGEWREDPDSPRYQGLYMIYEDLGNGMIRTHTAENLAPSNRLHGDHRCDGNFYPAMSSTGVPTGTSSSCRIVDAHNVTTHWIRDVDGEWAEGEGTSTLSSDGNHLTTVVEVKDRDGNVIQTNERWFTRNAENCLNHSDDKLFVECAARTRPRRN
jgi:Zn-dependent protease with chaperone function